MKNVKTLLQEAKSNIIIARKIVTKKENYNINQATTIKDLRDIEATLTDIIEIN